MCTDQTNKIGRMRSEDFCGPGRPAASEMIDDLPVSQNVSFEMSIPIKQHSQCLALCDRKLSVLTCSSANLISRSNFGRLTYVVMPPHRQPHLFPHRRHMHPIKHAPGSPGFPARMPRSHRPAPRITQADQAADSGLRFVEIRASWPDNAAGITLM